METPLLSIPLPGALPLATALVLGLLIAVLLLWRRSGAQSKGTGAGPSSSHARSNGAAVVRGCSREVLMKVGLARRASWLAHWNHPPPPPAAACHRQAAACAASSSPSLPILELS